MDSIEFGKVIDGLECCRPTFFESVRCKNKCTYDVYGHNEGGCVDHLISDALALLQKFKPAKPEFILTIGPGFLTADCPKCGKRINNYYHQSFCGYCGQEVKWE